MQISVYRSVGIGNMSHLRCDSGRRPQTLPPGGSCQESALRNRFLTEEECGKKTNCIVDVSGLGSGNAFRGLCRIPHVRLPPAFLFRPRCRSATCALRSARSAALTVHRTVIHYRRLRFAYPGGRYAPSALKGAINPNLAYTKSSPPDGGLFFVS